MSKTKLYKLINTVLSILVSIVAVYFLYQLIKSKEIDFRYLAQQIGNSKKFIFLVLILMPFNWIIETLKWRNLVLSIQAVSFSHSMKSILAGILFSLVTPNRIGELGGKLVFIEKGKRAAVLYYNSVCSFSQLLVTLLAGLFSLLILNNELYGWLKADSPLLSALFVGGSSGLLFLFFYSNSLNRMFSFFLRSGAMNTIKIDLLSRFKLLLYSAARYVVFCIQFYLLIQIFEIEISFFQSTSAIALIFFLTAIVPTGWISDLPVRTSIAFFIFELVGFQGQSGLSASILLWIVNLFIPALISLFLLRKVDWMGKLNWSK